MEEGTIAQWHKKVGDKVEAGDLLLEVSTDKATVEHNAIDDGWLRKILVQDGGEAKVNQPIAIFSEKKDENIDSYQPEGEVAAPSAPPVKAEAPPVPKAKPKEVAKEAPPAAKPEPKPSPAPVQEAKGRIIASPLARKLAATEGLDLAKVKGTGPGGRIMKRDLENAPKVGAVATASIEQRGPAGSYKAEPLTQMRKVIAQRLQEAKSTIPHFYVEQKVNVSALVNMRLQLKESGIVVTYNDLLIKAVALALRKHPDVNSGLTADGTAMMRFEHIDIAVAVSVKGGLLTPVVRSADLKSLPQISDEVRQLSARAKEGKLQPHEFQDGSFTISNLGMFGVTNFFAIINPPQAAILAISGIVNEPVIKNDQVVPGKTMSLSLSVDHRVIDGVAAAKFIKTLQSMVENPISILMG